MMGNIAVKHKIRGVAKEWLDAQIVCQTWSAHLKDCPSVVNQTLVHDVKAT